MRGRRSTILRVKSLSRRTRRTALAVLVLLVASGLFVGCRSTITPPPFPEHPTEVYLLTDARHYGLVLPDGPRRYVEYGFGEWQWYAQNDDAWYRTVPTVLWPTRATLGRRTIYAEDGRGVAERFHWIEVRRLVVDRPKVEALHASLAARFTAASAGRVHNPRYGFDFVPLDDESYWAFWNCTDALATWLEALGCDVSWVPLRVGFISDPRHVLGRD